MPKLFFYVVDHDYGFAPDPFGGSCTLAKCRYGTTKRNIVEKAEVGDWIAGTGGAYLENARSREAAQAVSTFGLGRPGFGFYLVIGTIVGTKTVENCHKQ